MTIEFDAKTGWYAARCHECGAKEVYYLPEDWLGSKLPIGWEDRSGGGFIDHLCGACARIGTAEPDEHEPLPEGWYAAKSGAELGDIDGTATKQAVDTGWCPFCDSAAFKSMECRACGRDRTRKPTLEERAECHPTLIRTRLGFCERAWRAFDPETGANTGVYPTREMALNALSEEVMRGSTTGSAHDC